MKCLSPRKTTKHKAYPNYQNKHPLCLNPNNNNNPHYNRYSNSKYNSLFSLIESTSKAIHLYLLRPQNRQNTKHCLVTSS